MKSKTTYLPTILFILIGIATIFAGYYFQYNVECGIIGYFFNPLCMLSAFFDFALATIGLIIGSTFIALGILFLMIDSTEKKIFVSLFLFSLIIWFITLVVPDPIPLVDEIVLPIMAGYFGVKLMKK